MSKYSIFDEDTMQSKLYNGGYDVKAFSYIEA
jgi:hypothetical protein